MKFKKINSIIFTLFFSVATIVTPIQIANASTQTPMVSQTPMTRSQVEQRALKMINLKWTYSKYYHSDISSKYSSSVILPKQFNNITIATMTGIPYNWGGLDGLDSSSHNAPWANFVEAVSQGAHTGNINTKSGYGYIPGTAGLDCSGFVQATFNICDYKLSTTTIFDKYFTKIDLKDIKHMDILNKPGYHVVIFDKWGYKNGIYGAYTYESTVDQLYGGIQGTKKYFRSMDEINNGYIAGRYVNIVEEDTSQNQVKPGIFAQIINVDEWANFRNNPSLSAPIIGTLPKGSIIYLKNYSSNWYQIGYNGKIGWVWGNLVGLLPSGKFVTVTNAYHLNIRSTPNTTSRIIGVLDKSKYAEVIGYSNNGQWFKINANGLTGWASSKYLSYIY